MATLGDLATQSAVAGGLVSVLIATINGVASRRRTRAAAGKDEAEAGVGQASASKTLIDAALSMMRPYQEQLDDLRAELAAERESREHLRAELAAERAQREESDRIARMTARLLIAHGRWDMQMLEALRSAGVPIPSEPPPLWPPDAPPAV